MLLNLYEEIVRRRAVDIIQQLGACGCDECLDDVCALTLNRLPSKYVSTRGGEVFSQLAINTTQGEAELMTALILAVKKVSDNPRHGYIREY